MFKRIFKAFCVLLVHCYIISSVAENIGQLPHCVDNTGQGLFIVSTLDGKLSALNSSGELIWELETGPGPLLKSNIHNVELTNNGEWIRLIPSLTGGLYKFNGKTIDAIPISGDSLLKSSFFYSHDLVIAGGKEVRTYGIGLQSGNIIYTCSLLGCQNETNFEGEIDSVLIIERNTLTVRAHEPRSGNERWNFSVGHHNIKMPSSSCVKTDSLIRSFNITAILPEGLLIATKINNKDEILWEYKFQVPIVNVWLFDGRDLSLVDTFDIPIVETDVKMDQSPSIYLAMHNKQLYIHESNKMLNLLQSATNTNPPIVETESGKKIPWKPIPASSTSIKTNDHDYSAALSVLYNSEYVNGNGYYLYVEADEYDKADLICNDNATKNAYTDGGTSIVHSLQKMWAYLVFTGLVIISVYFLFGPRAVIVTADVLPSSNVTDSGKPDSIIYDETEERFTSHYESSFDTVSCLGHGGFGVVFKVRQKIDECDYAIKRIKLRNDNSKEHVLREVKALATLDHANIVRYYNSWFERPPNGWRYEHDKKFINDGFSSLDTASVSTEEQEPVSEIRHKRSNSTIIDMSYSDVELPQRRDNHSDIDISFRDSKQNTNAEYSSTKISSNNSTETEHSSNYKLNRKNTNGGRVFLYIQMQLCKKESLKDWLFSKPNRTKSSIIPIFTQILDAVHYIHSKSLIHRDLKPTNIFFSLDNNIKVGDFGLVTSVNGINDDLSANITLLQSRTKGAGTELYMSPEQLEKKQYSFKVDIYSLGVILFELLVPFGTDSERIKMLTNLRNENYPEDFAQRYPDEHRLLKKMLSKIPIVRPTALEIKRTPPLSSTC